MTALADFLAEPHRATDRLDAPAVAQPEQACTCRVVGTSRDPYEPHIPAQAEWEQADDCPVHPLAAAQPERDGGAS